MSRGLHHLSEAELLAELAALQQAADRDFLANPAALATHLDDNYMPVEHLRFLGDVLGQLSAGSRQRVIVSTPPQIGKTVTCVVWTAFWWLILHPKHRVIIGSYGTSLATARGRDIRKLVERYGHRYGLALEPGSKSAADWKLASGGGVKSVGVGAGVAGVPGDLVIIDDPHKSRDEADSVVIRDKVYNWWSGDINSRLSPGAPVLLVMTLWHPDDLRARVVHDEGLIEEGGRWRFIKLPAYAGPDCPMGRAPGQPLSHPKVPDNNAELLRRHWEDKRSASTARDWGSLYMCDPQPAEGALIAAEMLRERRCTVTTARPVTNAVAIDPSGGGADICGIVGGFRGTDNRCYVTHDLSKRMPVDEWARTACELALQIHAEQIIIEANYGGDQAYRVIRVAWAALAAERGIPDMPPRIVTVHARKNKRLRAEPIAQQIIEDRVRFLGYFPELEYEWATWQPTDRYSPGRIDASVYLVWALGEVTSAAVAAVTDTSLRLPTIPHAGSGRVIEGSYTPWEGLRLPTIPGMPTIGLGG